MQVVLTVSLQVGAPDRSVVRRAFAGAGIHDGDLLVVDRSLDPRPGRVVVAVLDGAFTLKRLTRHRGRLRLEAANPAYPALELHRCGDVQIWGVAIHVIHPL